MCNNFQQSLNKHANHNLLSERCASSVMENINYKHFFLIFKDVCRYCYRYRYFLILDFAGILFKLFIQKIGKLSNKKKNGLLSLKGEIKTVYGFYSFLVSRWHLQLIKNVPLWFKIFQILLIYLFFWTYNVQCALSQNFDTRFFFQH